MKPLENRRVWGVAAERYPLNDVCAQPDCHEHAVDAHHCFPRSQIGNDSWFVLVEDLETPEVSYGPFAHVTGLCREHHNDVEDHRAWIKLQNGKFVWYERNAPRPVGAGTWSDEWDRTGPLNPQPGSVDPRPKRPRFKGEERRTRATVSLRVPKDAAEDGAGLLDDLWRAVEKRLGHDPPRPMYYSIVDSMSFVLANADETDV